MIAVVLCAVAGMIVGLIFLVRCHRAQARMTASLEESRYQVDESQVQGQFVMRETLCPVGVYDNTNNNGDSEVYAAVEPTFPRPEPMVCPDYYYGRESSYRQGTCVESELCGGFVVVIATKKNGCDEEFGGTAGYVYEQNISTSAVDIPAEARILAASVDGGKYTYVLMPEKAENGMIIEGKARLELFSSPSPMPSLFSRSRTTSTPHKNTLTPTDSHSPVSLDEFGRVQSRNSHRAGPFAISPSTPTKKDKKKAKELAKRAKTLGARADTPFAEPDQQPSLPDGSFLPLSLEPPRNDSEAGEQSRATDYGYLSYERHVVLGLEQLEQLVSVVAEELETRGGIHTPFIFSTTALDISASAIKRLIRSFLNVCAAQGSLGFNSAQRAWKEEAKFAGPHELGMCLRWGLARVVRVMGGIDVRGLIPWDIYSRFRDSEAAQGHPPGYFEVFLDELDPTLQVIVVRVLSLLTRLTANSTSSGHTPPTLSPLFGPLLFGLGPATLAFHHTYIHYLRAVNATEHLLLAFIRWQDTPRLAASSNSNAMYPSGSAAALGVPIRLREWIKGYPSMLPFLQEQKNVKPQPRKGAKTVTLTTVRRNVRMYSPDLVKTATTWAHRSRSSNGVINGLANSKEWERIAPATLKLPPRYSETYKKRMNLPPTFHPETAYNSGNTSSTSSVRTPTLASTLTIGTISQPGSLGDKDYFGLGKREGEDRFKSLTDLKWGEFESMGFSSIGDEKKLQFDLTESAREARAAKRQTMSWNDFSAAGFSRNDAPLHDTLQFSSPLALSVTNWPSRDAELTKKIKKTEKQLPPFGWDTEPVMGNEEIVEESFVDVFCDLVYGGGWMDLERSEDLDRDVNWALIEFKSLPPSRSTVPGGSDPRTATTLILFEEFVPLEYRQQLAVKSSNRRRIPAFFSPSKKQWKQAPTLNGRPYIVGHVPRSPSYREMEFEGLLQGGSGTKVISLGSKASTRVVSAVSSTPSHGPVNDGPPPPVPQLPPQATSSFFQSAMTSSPSNTASAPPATPSPLPALPRLAPPATPKSPRSDELQSATSESTMSPSTKKSASRFKITNVIPVPSPKRMSQMMVPPAEYSAVEFSTRLASYSDGEQNSGEADDGDAKGRKKRESRDDAWVDILVNSQSRRIAGQDVDPNAKKSADPDIASLEVAQVLAAVRGHRRGSSSSLGSISTSNEGDFVPHEPREHGPSIDMDAHVQGLEIDEIERVPRRMRESDESESSVEQGRRGGTLGYDDEDGEEYAADDEEHEHDQDVEHSQDLSHTHGMEHRQPQPELDESLLSVRHVLRQQRRMGYFDMHPERKQLYTSSAQRDEDQDDQQAPISAASYSPSPDIPSFDSSFERRRAEMEKSGLARADSATLPSKVENGHSTNGNGTPTSAPAAASSTQHPVGPRAPAGAGAPGTKTAALIEMYRERERRAAAGNSPVTNASATSTPPSAVPVPATPQPVAPLRAPVRSASLPGATNPNTHITSDPVVVTPDPSEPPASAPSDLIDPPRVPFDETGRTSPVRYVHGAPLHNVLEEEEEEL